MKVAVCIVGFRRPDDVAACLQALASSTHANFEVVICENGGDAAYQELARILPASLPGGQPVRVFGAPNPGFAGGVNLCMQASSDVDAWWVLNPDTLPRPGALAAMADRLAQGDCEAVGGPVQLSETQMQSYGGCWRLWSGRAISMGYGAPVSTPPPADKVEREQNFLNGASMLVGRAFRDRAGLMREDYFLYCEEVEWCLRGLAKGLRLGYAPEGVVLHHQGASTGHAGALRDRGRLPVYLNERNRLLLTRDLFPGRLPVTALLALLVLSARFARARAWRQLGFALEGWWAGLRNERGPLTTSNAVGA